MNSEVHRTSALTGWIRRLDQRGALCIEPTPGQIGEDLRVAFAGDERFDHLPS
jgi:hypothetical protein